MSALPPEIGQLTSLSTLFLENNHLESLLSNLSWLKVEDNQLTSLPPEIGQLTSLSTLFVASNQLTSLPPEIDQLTTSLDVFHEQGYADAEGHIILDSAGTPHVIEGGFWIGFTIDAAAKNYWGFFFAAPQLEVRRIYDAEFAAVYSRSVLRVADVLSLLGERLEVLHML